MSSSYQATTFNLRDRLELLKHIHSSAILAKHARTQDIDAKKKIVDESFNLEEYYRITRLNDKESILSDTRFHHLPHGHNNIDADISYTMPSELRDVQSVNISLNMDESNLVNGVEDISYDSSIVSEQNISSELQTSNRCKEIVCENTPILDRKQAADEIDYLKERTHLYVWGEFRRLRNLLLNSRYDMMKLHLNKFHVFIIK